MSERRNSTFRCPHNTLYHCTPYVNRFLVNQNGILAELDRRGKNRIWLTCYGLVNHVAEHLTKARNISVAQFAIFEVKAYLLPIFPRNCGREGIYYVDYDIAPHHIDFAGSIWTGLDILDEWIDDTAVYTFSEEYGRFRPQSAC